MTTARLTGAQAIVRYLIAEEIPYVVGIFGHGNIQLGEALYENRAKIRFLCAKNEQTPDRGRAQCSLPGRGGRAPVCWPNLASFAQRAQKDQD